MVEGQFTRTTALFDARDFPSSAKNETIRTVFLAAIAMAVK
jgi:hypothetical protein